MADLIDRQKVLSLPRLTHRTLSGEIVAEYISVADIEALPSTQPEIIRCKDCKHYTLKPQVNSNYCYIRHCTRSALISSKPDDYCSWAERRADG